MVLLAGAALTVGTAAACSGGGGGQPIVATGTAFSCLLDDSQVYCWGANSSGQLGIGGLPDSVPMKSDPVELGAEAVDVAAGDRHACAVTADGTVYCWGSNSAGQLGGGTTVEHSRIPVKVLDIDNAVGVALGWKHSCAVLDNGGARCWGLNTSGQLGNGKFGHDENAYEPQVVGGLRDVVQLAAGEALTCAVTSEHEVYCWGTDFQGRTSIEDIGVPNLARPTLIEGLPGRALSVGAGRSFACALVDDGKVYCWGFNQFAELGKGEANMEGTAFPIPQEVIGIDGEVLRLAIGSTHSCAATSNDVFCWGTNLFGQLGALSDELCFGDPCHPSAVLVEPLEGRNGLVSIDAAYGHTCAAFRDGDVTCWGRNSAGALGDGTDVDSLDPVTVVDGRSTSDR